MRVAWPGVLCFFFKVWLSVLLPYWWFICWFGCHWGRVLQIFPYMHETVSPKNYTRTHHSSNLNYFQGCMLINMSTTTNNRVVEKEATEAAEAEEEEQRWAALQRLPIYKSIRKGLLRQVVDDGKVNVTEIDLQKLGKQQKKVLVESVLKFVEEDFENFLTKLRDRIHR